jgi:YD repeat-containing protein
MASSNILNAVFEHNSEQNNNMVKQQTEYISSGNRFLVGKIKANTGQYQAIEDRVIFDSYNSAGKPIQVSYKDGPKISYLWGYNGQYPIAKIENAANSDVAYTSFEDDYSGSNWTFSGTSGTVNATYAHTGAKSYTLGIGGISKTGLTNGKQYIVSYRSRSGSVTISNSSGYPTTGNTINGWTYYEHRITLSSTSITISGNGKIIDELRLYPVGAMMTTYTHEPLWGVTSETDPSGRSIFFEYDNFGRLKCVKDEDGKILKDHRYNYVK